MPEEPLTHADVIAEEAKGEKAYTPKASKKLIDLMNAGASREIQVAIQCIWQHIMVHGPMSESVSKVLEEIAIAEMKHYEKIAERIDYFGQKPITKPAEIKFGDSIKQMLELDKKAEEEAIILCKQTIIVATAENDPTTAHLFQEILEQEEDHYYKFSTLVEIDKALQF
jgi:bacterioferritin